MNKFENLNKFLAQVEEAAKECSIEVLGLSDGCPLFPQYGANGELLSWHGLYVRTMQL